MTRKPKKKPAAKRKKAKKETTPVFTEIDKAEALGCYIRSNGDMEKTFRLLEGRIPRKTLVEWRDLYLWNVYREKSLKILFDDVLIDETTRKREQLLTLHIAKQKIYQALSGHRDEKGRFLINPTAGTSIESLIDSLLRVQNREREIVGDAGLSSGQEEEGQDIGLLHFVKTIIETAKTGNQKPAGPAPGEVIDSSDHQTDSEDPAE